MDSRTRHFCSLELVPVQPVLKLSTSFDVHMFEAKPSTTYSWTSEIRLQFAAGKLQAFPGCYLMKECKFR